MFERINYLFLFFALIAEVIGTIGGFGSSVFFVPISSFFFDFQTVLGLTAIFHLSSNLSKIALFRKGLDKKLLLYIGVPSVLFVILGGILSNYLDSYVLKIILAIFLIGFSLLFLIKKELVIKPGPKQSITGGVLSGFTAGLLGTGGAIRGITMAAFNLEKTVFIATSAAIDFAIDFTRTIVYFKNGFIHQHDLIYVPFLLIIGLIGTYIGKYILQFIPQERFKQTSLVLILFIGIIMVIQIAIN
ncbi:sulfite exporter TauE/SafE family protein [Flavobacterium sediminilitoris]|uniref:Probable membrane transporter protein n=1 Tax=Flavobacterium sediminilitoris TaxID=2024526 RepID=A0ABY4HJE7_9FLAO|nr:MULTISPECIES: sulfite exporter TauE/SafE family protein [Flavobacterium]UOX32969.1 sulfite exporter TauE/SafE family protein [Flavobacterium sediminilitoris]